MVSRRQFERKGCMDERLQARIAHRLEEDYSEILTEKISRIWRRTLSR